MYKRLTTKGLCGCLVALISSSIYAEGSSSNANFQLVKPIEGEPSVDMDLARVGWHLFRDPKLSSNGQISCETCHDLQTNGAEPSAVSTGVNGLGIRNSITVFNAALNYRFLWDGTVNSLMAQIDGPVLNPLEMDSSWNDIEQYVKSEPTYKALFKQADGREINTRNIKGAIVEFVKGLQTPGAPFDSYLLGYTHVLDEQAIRGWQTFQEVGCVQCHQGKNVGGSMIQRFTYFQTPDVDLDSGRRLRTIDGEDKFYFRVASLRNVGQTSPYFHNGKVDKLSDAIQIMSQTQLGVTMSDDKVADIEAFLNTLSAPRPSILEVFENE
ncbi:cytochrome-c peroxidase [Vibrio hyugaensis]|uniref:cytochrome-c peroxidase n=1 Tax=Vibrio hyugaensis TaxID=1534743 RepID=UPI000CE362EF|nr:cytochrome c peroxidase [Vibrio hyugaensis]